MQDQQTSQIVIKEQPQNFDEKLKTFCSKNKICLYILTPCFGSLCYVSYVSSLINTLNVLKSYNIDYELEFCRNDSLVSRARNNLVARAMSNPKMTHMIFIDNDITWNPVEILKLLVSEKQLIGGIYPIKKYNWDKILVDKSSNTIEKWLNNKNNSYCANMSDETFLQHKLLKYNVNYLSNAISIKDNLSQIKHLPTGFMMIRRDVIEIMAKAYSQTKYTDDVSFLRPNENEFAYALFDCGVEDDHYYSEDWLFCHRWSKIGGEVWMDVSINLVHTGIEDFNGSYLASLV